ncbi:hypothetical protein LCGC14_1020770 [marine sediment metagenome]|uniref:Uncharacterized protein n=1 Tax=marine sediment metagenome TaxID=412755 RepID=A0A0F9N203_9ZZZZ
MRLINSMIGLQHKWPKSLLKLTEEIEMGSGIDRLIVKTPLGKIIIDSRLKDVNCFYFVDGKRVDTILLSK